MVVRTKKARAAAGAGVILAGLGLVALALTAGQGGAAAATEQERAVIGEARPGSLTVGLNPAMADIKLTEASVPGRPIVVIDATGY